MKTFFILALLALAAAGADTAQFDAFRGHGAQEKQQTECQEGQAMDACRDYLKKQCTASMMSITWPWKWWMGSCRVLRQRCCKQLEQIPPSFRCKAICSTVQEMQGSEQGGGRQMMSKVRKTAKTLPSICNMIYPSYCNIPTTGGCYY